MRPGHFWACELGDADELDSTKPAGSPILAGPFDTEQQHLPPNEGEAGWKDAYRGIARQRYDAEARPREAPATSALRASRRKRWWRGKR